MAQPSQRHSLDAERPHSTAVCILAVFSSHQSQRASLPSFTRSRRGHGAGGFYCHPSNQEREAQLAPPYSWPRGPQASVNPAPSPRQGLAEPSQEGRASEDRLRPCGSSAGGAEWLPWPSCLCERRFPPGLGQGLNRALGFPKIKLHIL